MKRILGSFMLVLFVLGFTAVSVFAQTENPMLNEALALHGNGDLEQAIAKYQLVVDQSDKDSDVKLAKFSIGACYLSLKDCASAVLAFERFAKDYPDDPKSPLGLTYAGNCKVQQGLWAEAEPYYLRALDFKQNPENTHTWIAAAFLGIGKVLMHNGDYTDAAACFKQVMDRAVETSQSEEAANLESQCFKGVDKPEQISKMGRAIGLVNYHIGRLYFDDKKYSQAVTPLQKAAPKLTDGNKQADCYLKLGEGFYNLKKYNDAIAVVGNVAKIADTTPSFVEKLSDYLAESNYWRSMAMRQLNK